MGLDLIMDLNKVLEHILGKHFHDFGEGNNFLNRTQEAWTIKKKIDELGYIKIKHLLFIKRYLKGKL